jgi:exopolysaccharide biosynthesis protein
MFENARQSVEIIALAALIAVLVARVPVLAAPSPYVLRAYASGVAVIAVQIDLSSPEMKVSGAIAKGGAGHSEAWTHMIARTRPAVAITGTYFDSKTHQPIGDIVIDGRLSHFGGKGAAFCVTGDNHAKFVSAPDNRHIDWSPYDFVIRSGPRLVEDGTAGVRNICAEGFRDPALRVPSGRLGIAITKDGNLILAATRQKITLSKWAKALKALGAANAMNLDAGPCMGLYVNGETIIKPKCELTNIVVVYNNKRAGHNPPALTAARQLSLTAAQRLSLAHR